MQVAVAVPWNVLVAGTITNGVLNRAWWHGPDSASTERFHWRASVYTIMKHRVTSQAGLGWGWGGLVPMSWLRATFMYTFLVHDLVQWNLVAFITQVKCVPPFVRDAKFIHNSSCHSHWIHNWLCSLWSTENKTHTFEAYNKITDRHTYCTWNMRLVQSPGLWSSQSPL